MVFTYFTIRRANQVLPEVIKKFEAVLRNKETISKLEHQLQVSTSSSGRLEEYITLKQKLNSAVVEFYNSIDELERTGAVTKSIDEGLLDFPSMRFNEEVWLCWKYGETEIKFWHEKDSGFMGRKPLEISDDDLV